MNLQDKEQSELGSNPNFPGFCGRCYQHPCKCEAAKEATKPEGDLVDNTSHYEVIRNFAHEKARFITANIGAGKNLTGNQVYSKIESAILEAYLKTTEFESLKAKEHAEGFAEWIASNRYGRTRSVNNDFWVWSRKFELQFDPKLKADQQPYTTSDLYTLYLKSL